MMNDNYNNNKFKDTDIINFAGVKEKKKEIKKNQNLKKNSEYINYIQLERNISLIKTIFFEKNENKEKIIEFNQKYASYLNNSNRDILLIIREFPEFNLFDYTNPDFNLQSNDEKSKNDRRRAMYARNNIFLNILIESHLVQNQVLLPDLSFLRPHVDTFKNILCERDNSVQIEIDVDVFFLSFFGYKDKSRSIILKFNDYFKNFIKEFSDNENQARLIFENLDIISEKEFDDLSLEELIILRKILNNCAKRKFIKGLQYLSQDESFCCCLTEGRIWMNLMKNFSPQNAFNFWNYKLLPVISSLNRVDFRPSITEEYAKIINKHNDNEEIEKIKNLDFVINLENFLKVAFKLNKKDLAMFACENAEEKLLTPKIFELCLMNDEEIAIFVQVKAIDNDNVKDYYMKVAMIKKYFRLACRLSRFTVCKNFLNVQKFNDDVRYVSVMNKFHIEEKKNFHLNLKKDEHENNDDSKIIYENEIKREELNLKEEVNKKDNDDPIPSSDLKTNDLINSKFRKELHKDTSQQRPIEKKSKYSSIVHNIKSLFNTEVKSSTNYNIEMENQDNKLPVLSMKERKNNHSVELNSNSIKESNQYPGKIFQLEFLKSSAVQAENIINNEEINFSSLKKSENHEKNEGDPDSGNKEEKRKKEKNSNDRLKELDFDRLKNISINVQLVLIDHLRSGQYIYYCICLLSSIPERYLILEYSEKICKSFLIFIQDEDAISKCRYPILLCVLAAEFLNKLAKTFNIYGNICHSVSHSLLNLAACIQTSMKDEEMLDYYLREQIDHNKRSALEIIAENRFYDLLKDENVASIVGKLWYGGGRNFGVDTFSRITKVLFANIKHEHYETAISTNRKNQLFSFQFISYAKNCSLRYLTSSVSVCLTSIFYQYIIYSYVSLSIAGIFPETDSSFRLLNLIANIIVFTIIFKQIMHLLYIIKTRQAIKFNLFRFLDIIMFLAALCNIMRWPMSLFNENDENRRFIESIIYSIIIVCAWMRVIEILMTTRTYGPFLRTMYLTLSTVFNFIVILIGFTSLFAQVFTILFKDSNNDFESFSASWMTLFAANFGTFNYQDYYRMKVFGYSVLIFYTTCSNVMLLNLVIAIVNHLYESYEPQADAENRAVLVLTYEKIKWDDEYGLLILLPPPFNIFTVVFVIILLLIKNKKSKQKWNLIFSKIFFIVIAIPRFILFLFISLVSFPLASLKSLIHSAYDNSSKFKSSMVLKILLEIIIRPGKLFYYLLEDSVVFWKLVYKNENEVKEEKKSLINQKIVIKLRKALIYFRYIKKKKVINLDDIYAKFGISAKIRNRNPEKSISSNSLEASVSNIHATSNTNQAADSPKSEFNSTNSNLPILQLTTVSNDSSINDDKTILAEEFNRRLKYLINKIVDRDNMIDIDRTLSIIPQRVKYSDHFINSLYHLNMRRLLKGVKTYFYLKTSENPTYTFQKLQKLLKKILIKFKLIYSCMPESVLKELTEEKFVEINNDNNYEKTVENLNRLAERDEFSDQEDSKNYLISVDANLMSLKNHLLGKTSPIISN